MCKDDNLANRSAAYIAIIQKIRRKDVIMKKSLLAIFLCTSVVAGGMAQESSTQRSMPVSTLIEEFTNSGCGPCAAYAPVLDSVVSYRLGEAIAIKYHGVYPDRNDPFYLAQKEDLNKKILFYNISGYPTTIINGTEVGAGLSSAMLNAFIDNNSTKEWNYALEAESTVEDKKADISVTLTPKQDADGKDLKLFVCLMEEYVKLDQRFSNGEDHVRYTVRRILPNGDGYSLGEQQKAGQAYTFDTSAQLDDFVDVRQLGVVTFLQNMSTKEVLAAAYIPRMASGSNSVIMMNLEDTPDRICTPDYYGRVTFRNVGHNAVTSATINVSVNGTVKAYPWSGNLGYLDKAVVSFDGFDDFALNNATGNNEVEVWLSDINGGAERSNSFITSFRNSIQASGRVEMKLYTDNKPEEITWAVLNSAGDKVAEGGPYTEARHFYTEKFDLESDDCYMLQLYDAGGNGIKGANGNGYYQIFEVNTDGKRTRIAQSDYDDAECDVAFRLDNAATAIETATDDMSGRGRVAVTDVSGRRIAESSASDFSLSSVNKNGVVLVTKTHDGKTKTEKVLLK